MQGAVRKDLIHRDVPGLLPSALLWRVVAGVVFGLGIGLVSSLLGVAGGELIVPTMVFAFGAASLSTFRDSNILTPA